MQMTLQLWVEDTPGTLMRVTGILTSKGCNIRFLNLAPDPWKPGISRMIIHADVTERLQDRVVKEMNRLVNVLHAVDMTHQRREAAC